MTGIATFDIQNAWAWKDEVEEDEADSNAKEIAADDHKPQIAISDSASGDHGMPGPEGDTDVDGHDSDKPDVSDTGGKKKRNKKKA